MIQPAKFYRMLQSNEGMSLIAMALAINVMVFLGAATSLLLSNSLHFQLTTKQSGDLAEEASKNGVVLTKKLIDLGNFHKDPVTAQCIVAKGLSSNTLWKVVSNPGLSNLQIEYQYCDPKNPNFVDPDGGFHKPENCPVQKSISHFAEATPDARQRIYSTVTEANITRSLSALLDPAVPTPNNPNAPCPDDCQQLGACSKTIPSGPLIPITTETEFAAMTSGTQYELKNDIDLSPSFRGVTSDEVLNVYLNGNGHSLKNYQGNRSFILRLRRSTITNLKMENINLGHGSIVPMAASDEAMLQEK